MSSDENWQRKVVFERGRVEMKCDHGQLARTCLLCEMRDENLKLKALLRAVAEEVKQLSHEPLCNARYYGCGDQCNCAKYRALALLEVK